MIDLEWQPRPDALGKWTWRLGAGFTAAVVAVLALAEAQAAPPPRAIVWKLSGETSGGEIVAQRVQVVASRLVTGDEQADADLIQIRVFQDREGDGKIDSDGDHSPDLEMNLWLRIPIGGPGRFMRVDVNVDQNAEVMNTYGTVEVEDSNRNGQLDPGDERSLFFSEDANRNDRIDPGEEREAATKGTAPLPMEGMLEFSRGLRETVQDAGRRNAPIVAAANAYTAGVLSAIGGHLDQADEDFQESIRFLTSERMLPGQRSAALELAGEVHATQVAFANLFDTVVHGGLARLDVDGNCFIEDDEFLVVIDSWINGRIADDLFFPAIDAWTQQTNICSTSASTIPAAFGLDSVRSERLPSDGAITFSARGYGIQSLRIQIYDLSGRRIFRGSSTRSQLRWALQTDAGYPVANGVYLYAITGHGQDGQISRSAIKKLAVLR